MRDDFEGLNIIESSLFTDNDAAYALLQDGGELKLAILETDAGDWQGERIPKNTHSLVIAPKTPHNTALLRKRLPWLNPSLLGLRTSAGMGDRLGWATPGHIRAVRDVGGKIAPIFAQQSIREMNRTGRTAQQVIDDAVWGIFQESWQDGFGADADHLKTEADIDTCL